jgi:hypothetical protein
MAKIEKDIKILKDFIQIYCNTKHKNRSKTSKENSLLCEECHDTLTYAIVRRRNCPLNPKPTCKNCDIHCYKNEYREKIIEIMRHSGMILIKRGRIDLIFHYFF